MVYFEAIKDKFEARIPRINTLTRNWINYEFEKNLENFLVLMQQFGIQVFL